MDLFTSKRFSTRVHELMDEWHVPGLAIAVIQGERIESRGYGKADEGKAVTADTVFDIASSSKSLTAAAVALLVEDDEEYPQIKWDTPASKLLPDDFVLADPEYTAGITVDDILSHRTGLPSHDLCSFSPRAAHPDTPQTLVKRLRYLELAAPIRSKHMYSNLMFTVAAYLVEKMSGCSFHDFLKQHIWDQLGMNATTLQSKHAIEAGLEVAQPYHWNEGTSTYEPVGRLYSPESIGAGLVVTSVKDYARWVRAMMNQTDPITQEVYDGLTKPRSFEQCDDLSPYTSPLLYCAGLVSHYYRGYQVIGHSGRDPGLATRHFFIPHKKFGAVIFGNSAGATNVHNVLSRELIDNVLGVVFEERPDWNALERELEQKDDREEEEGNQKRRTDLCSSVGGPTPQPGSLERYSGTYWNGGYREVKVEVDDSYRLIIDATDRTMGFTLKFEHLCSGTKYIAQMIDYDEGNVQEIAAEFVFESEKAVKLGLELEADLPGKRVWFERMDLDRGTSAAISY